jgi:hypothetical protein
MRFVPFLFSASILTACSHSQVQLNAGAASSSSSGGAISSSGAGVNVQGGGSSAAALIGLGIAAAIVYRAETEREGYGVRYNANPFMAITDSARAPEMAPVRKVNEQDCTKPIEDFSANLKCR